MCYGSDRYALTVHKGAARTRGVVRLPEVSFLRFKLPTIPRLVPQHRRVDETSTEIRLVLMKMSGGHIRLKVQGAPRVENQVL
jgi:hypothetical protein